MLLSTMVLAACLALPADGSSFRLLDVEAIDGRPIVQYRPVELGTNPVRPLAWEEPPPEGTQFGLARVGPTPESALAVAWHVDSAALWLDADGDGRMANSERHVLKSGDDLTIPATLDDGDGGTLDRVLLFRPGLLGSGPRWAVRGGMEGMLTLGGEDRRALLIDGDADGCFHTPGTDRIWLDLNGDGRFDPITEQFPLGAPIRLGTTTYTVASDPWARSVSAVERDNRLGQLVLNLGASAPVTEVDRIVVHLINASGELARIQALGEAVEVPVGAYRLSSIELSLNDDLGRRWTYSFSGRPPFSIIVAPDETTAVALLDGLALEVFTPSGRSTRPGASVDVTPRLTLASGLYLTDCTAGRPEIRHPTGRTATILLKSTDGDPLDRTFSGFQ